VEVADSRDETAKQFGQVMALEDFCNRSREPIKTAFDRWLTNGQLERLDNSRLQARFLAGYQQGRSVLMEELDFSRCDEGSDNSRHELQRLIR